MIKLRRLSLIIISYGMITVAALGCVNKVPEEPIVRPLARDTHSSVLYIYRPFAFKGGAAPVIYINDVKAFDLGKQEYSAVLLRPGSYHVVIKGDGSDAKSEHSYIIETDEKGKNIYIRISFPGSVLGDVGEFSLGVSISIAMGSLFTSGPGTNYAVELIPEEYAEKEMKDCRYVEPEVKIF